jgi:DNA-binding response OmpR family regulator
VTDTLLVVESEQQPRDLIRTWLAGAGYETLSGANGAEGLKVFYHHQPDMVVAEVEMPDMDGFEFCRLVHRSSNAPIILLSARDDEAQRIKGLDAGADDYMVKPVGMNEFLARVAALLRRRRWSEEGPERELSYHDSEITILHERHEVLVGGEQVYLTPIEFKLMRVLTESAGSTCSIDEIRMRVWGSPHYSPEAVRWHIASLRNKIEADAGQAPRRIVTVWGVGYRYEVPAPSPPESGRP